MSPDLAFAIEAARAAGELALRYFQSETPVEQKPDESPVTRADREAEALIRERISRAYPGHAVLGEEMGLTGDDREDLWVIDPIDGTKSFIHGVPLFAVLIGLQRAGTAALGVAHFPALDETYCAEVGAGAFRNGVPITVSRVDRIEDGTLVAGSYRSLSAQKRLAGFEALARRAKVTRTWGDAYGHCLVARGSAEIMLDPIVNLWDTCALMPIVKEAGGTFTNFAGVEGHGHGEAISTNGRLLESAIEVFE